MDKMQSNAKTVSVDDETFLLIEHLSSEASLSRVSWRFKDTNEVIDDRVFPNDLLFDYYISGAWESFCDIFMNGERRRTRTQNTNNTTTEKEKSMYMMHMEERKQSSRGPRNSNRLKTIAGIAATVVSILAIILITDGHRTIQQGYVGVKYRFGEVVETGILPGWRWKAPFVDRIETVDTREQVYQATINAYTKDTQVVEGIELTVNWSYDTSQLAAIINNIGLANVESKLIVPQINSIVKNATGKFKAEELVQNRSGLQEQAEGELRQSLAPYGINIHALNIKNLDFEDSFEEAVRKKVVAEQEAQETVNRTAKIEEEANQQVIRAQAEADAKKLEADAEAYSIRVIQEQLAQSPEYVDYVIAEKWNGEWPQVMGNTVNPFVTISGSSGSTGGTATYNQQG